MHSRTLGLYKDAYERDSCGFGLIASLDDAPSHWLVRTAMSSLNRLTHRGAIAADGKTGDGCGLLLKKPEKFLRAVAAEAGIALAPRFASGLVFLSPEPAAARARARDARRGADTPGPRACRLARGADRAERLRCGGREDAAAHRAAVRQRQRRRARRGGVQPPPVHGAASGGEGARGRCALLRAEPVGEHHRLQGHGDAPATSRSSTPTSPMSGSRVRWRCFTSASRPTRCRSGASRTRTATLRTTARSTPCRATATGRGRAGRS